MALLAESNLGKSHKSNVPYVPPHHRQSSSSSTHRFNNSNNKYRPSSSSSIKSNFNRASVPAPSFSTPIKLHNVQLDDVDSDTEQTDPIYTADIDYEQDLSDSTTTPSFHDDNTGDGTTENDLACLNAMRFHENAKRHQPSLTTDEIDRRRRNNTCFKCNRAGHYANNCTSSSSSNSQSKKL